MNKLLCNLNSFEERLDTSKSLTGEFYITKLKNSKIDLNE